MPKPIEKSVFILGAKNSGKTTLAHWLANKPINKDLAKVSQWTKLTSDSFTSKSFQKKQLTLNISDHQLNIMNRFSANKSKLVGKDAIILTVNMKTNPDNFEKHLKTISGYIETLKENDGTKDIPILLVATKCIGLPSHKKKAKQVKKFAETNNLEVMFVDTKAQPTKGPKKTAPVKQVLEAIAKTIKPQQQQKKNIKSFKERTEWKEHYDDDYSRSLDSKIEPKALDFTKYTTDLTLVEDYLNALTRSDAPEECLQLFNSLTDVIRQDWLKYNQDKNYTSSNCAHLYFREEGLTSIPLTSKGNQVWPSLLDENTLHPVSETFNYIVRVTRLKILQHYCADQSNDINYNSEIEAFFDKQTKAPAQGMSFFGVDLGKKFKYDAKEQTLFKELKSLQDQQKPLDTLRKTIEKKFGERESKLKDLAEARDKRADASYQKSSF